MENIFSGNFGFVREIDLINQLENDAEGEYLGVCGFIDNDLELERLEKMEDE